MRYAVLLLALAGCGGSLYDAEHVPLERQATYSWSAAEGLSCPGAVRMERVTTSYDGDSMQCEWRCVTISGEQYDVIYIWREPITELEPYRFVLYYPRCE